MTRAPLSTAQRIALASASTGIARDLVTTFAMRSSDDGARPAMPIPLSMARPDEARDERAVTERVHAGRATDEALRTEDPAREVWMAGIDAGVDDRDRNRLERGQRDPRGVEAAVREVPLLRHERIARREREMTRESGST